MTTAPTITTKRLTLRHHRIEDFEPMAAIFATDWAVHMDGPYSRDEMWRWFCVDVAGWSLQGHGAWAVDLTETGETVGQVGINNPTHFPEIELGWFVYPAFEGKGMAYEAAQVVRDWAYETLKLDTLVSYISPDNARSAALATRLGAQRDADTAGPCPEDVVYRHPKPEFV